MDYITPTLLKKYLLEPTGKRLEYYWYASCPFIAEHYFVWEDGNSLNQKTEYLLTAANLAPGDTLNLTIDIPEEWDL